MGKNVASERRGAIALLVIIAVIVAALAIYSRLGTAAHVPPALSAPEISADTALSALPTVTPRKHKRGKQLADSSHKYSRKKKTGSPKKRGITGRERDYLDEPVEASGR